MYLIWTFLSSITNWKKSQENNELMQRIKENQALIEEESQDMNENGYTQRDFVSKETFEEAKKDLLETIRGLKKEISDSELNFEHERDQFNKELSKKDVIIAERDNEILVLKQSNPNVIVQGEIYLVCTF